MNPPGGDGRIAKGTVPLSSDGFRELAREVAALDRSVCGAVVATPTPLLDGPITRISDAANYSRLWLMTALLLAAIGGPRGRRAAVRGVVAIGATSLVANVAAKHVFPRGRPDRSAADVRSRIRMPTSSSFPSGHTAAAFAFTTAVTAEAPVLSPVLYALASLVGVSRVLTGVHYPSDVIAGGILGLTMGNAVRAYTQRASHRRLSPYT